MSEPAAPELELADARALLAGAFAEAVKPRRPPSLSAWADAERYLSSKGSGEPGPWRTDRAPHTREIMDCLSASSPIKKVVLKFCSQASKTEIGLNWIGYVIRHVQAPMLAVVPTLEVRKRWVLQRLNPLLRESPALAAVFDAQAAREAANSEDVKDFPGGFLVIGGANSAASLASMPIRFVLADEIDRFPWDVGGEGDPLGLVDQRQSTFTRRKTLLLSTPTIKGASRISQEYEDSDQREWHVPCPHCQTRQTLKLKNLAYALGSSGQIASAWCVCEHCGERIEEEDKTFMLPRGAWIPKNPGHPTRGYHFGGLATPLGLGYTWIEIAERWVQAQGDESKLKRFRNTIEGEDYESAKSALDEDAVKARAEDVPARLAPPGCLLITAGVDRQNDRLAVQLVGWGRKHVCWVLDYVELGGSPGEDEVWDDLERYLSIPIANAYGRELTVSAVCMDYGGQYHHADLLEFVRRRRAKNAFAIQGHKRHGAPAWPLNGTQTEYNFRGVAYPKHRGVMLYTIGVGKIKDALASRLIDDTDKPPAQRKIRFPANLPAEYYRQLMSEGWDPHKQTWIEKPGRAHEALDTWVYAFAASLSPPVRAHMMTLADWDRLAKTLEPENAAAEPPPPPASAPLPAREALAQPAPAPAPRKKASFAA
jgi:phage terminase large subunit GpA-like protein